jgi:hypothetical protein
MERCGPAQLEPHHSETIMTYLNAPPRACPAQPVARLDDLLDRILWLARSTPIARAKNAVEVAAAQIVAIRGGDDEAASTEHLPTIEEQLRRAVAERQRLLAADWRRGE